MTNLTRHVAFVSLLALSSIAIQAAPASCDSLAKLSLPNLTVKTAEAVPAGSFTPPGSPAINGLPAFCRVAGTIKPSPDSDIEIEVWMPSTGWNGKFEGIGNGGYAGAISYGPMAAAVQHGYATASTDTGHKAGGTDAGWALGHPEKVTDFGYRAIHETAEKAKAIIHGFYGEAPKRSYFESCSNGGRQALMEAQRFPADYDGIVAGAPANNWTHLLTTAAYNMTALLNDPASYIPAAKLAAIEQANLEACDALDGVKDGVIDDPSACHPNLSKLLCSGAETNSCLTAPQLAALEKLYGGLKGVKGEQIFPGYSPGGENGMNGWGGWISGAAREKSLQYAFGNNFFQNMVYSDAKWDYHTFKADSGMKVADDTQARNLNATDPDLKKFKDRGGKLIIYHGWSDAAIPPMSTVIYYQNVVSKMGAKDSAAFVRLFMVPGMQHCGGGPGPNSFGQSAVTGGDPMHDVDAAIQRWVEQGTAPEQIIATKYKGASPASGVERTRPLCKYPQVAKYKGSGSTDDAANFSCADKNVAAK
ncbi:MAG TPA: tannase/feruloyl esterase family alpha/beta hydrolase [Bryobacteraceae bacterium]|nr:tannase/feruloyl esterase family alpha/beta hydrolase [Bryobacteraceae bacterium]